MAVLGAAGCAGGGGPFELGGAATGVRAARDEVAEGGGGPAGEDLLLATHDSWRESLAYFGTGGRGLGITGHLPLVRADR